MAKHNHFGALIPIFGAYALNIAIASTLIMGLTLSLVAEANARTRCKPDAPNSVGSHCRRTSGARNARLASRVADEFYDRHHIYGHATRPAAVQATPPASDYGLTRGKFYPGHGYWEGTGFFRHREQVNGTWRYSDRVPPPPESGYGLTPGKIYPGHGLWDGHRFVPAAPQ